MLTVHMGYPESNQLIKFYDSANEDRFVSDICPEGWADKTLQQKLDVVNIIVKNKKRRGEQYNLIRYNGELVGLSMPVKLDDTDPTRCKYYKISPNDGYWKFGLVVLFPEHRGKGYAKAALKQFMKKYPKIAWCAELGNTSSIKVALSAGLTLSHELFYIPLTKEHYFSRPTARARYLSFNIYKN